MKALPEQTQKRAEFNHNENAWLADRHGDTKSSAGMQ
jgi:hypothetical protein